MKPRQISVGRRLIGLVAIEILCGGGLLVLLLVSFSLTKRDLAFMGRFVVDPIGSIATALEHAANLETVAQTRPADAAARAHALTGELEEFVGRYQSDWQVADHPGEDQRKFRAMVMAAGKGDLI